MSGFPKEFSLSMIRHALTIAGGYLVSAGLATDMDVQSFVGVTATIIGLAWAGLDKWSKAQA